MLLVACIVTVVVCEYRIIEKRFPEYKGHYLEIMLGKEGDR